jgi:uncharacterized delta-60 repeat protein
MKERADSSSVGRATLALALTALGAGFFACAAEFELTCPEGTYQAAGGGDVNDADVCKPIDQGGSGGAPGASGAGNGDGNGAAGAPTAGGGGQAGMPGAGAGGSGGGVVAGPPGTLDESFGKGGKADFGALSMVGPSAFDFQSTGKIVAAGYATFSDTSSKSLIIRFDEGGNIDATFGEGKGYVVDTINDPRYGGWHRVAALANDKLIGGPESGYYEATAQLIRLTPDGDVDSSFSPFVMQRYTKLIGLMPAGDAGYYYAHNGESSNLLRVFKFSGANGDEQEYDVSPQVDGKFLVDVAPSAVVDPQDRVVFARSPRLPGPAGPSLSHFYGLARVTSDGQGDTVYNVNGFRDLGVGESLWNALDRSGRSLVAGYLGSTPVGSPGYVGSSAVVSRSSSTGQLDTTFGVDGATPEVASTRWQCVVADDAERVVVVGTYAVSGSQALRIGRYGANGFPDVSYGVEGSGFATLAQGVEVSVKMCKLDKQGRLVVAGAVRSSAGAPLEPFLARVWN